MRARVGIVALLAVGAAGSAGCEAPPAVVEAPAPHWVYPPVPTSWQLGAPRGRIGRSQPPQLAPSAGIVGAAGLAPLRLATAWQVPGDGPARAVLYGMDGDRAAVELIDIDGGRVVWRDAVHCRGAVVGVTERSVVCSDADGVRAVGLADGAPAWRAEQMYLALTEDRVVVWDGETTRVLDADDGGELSRVALPAGVALDAVIASCGDAGRELFASGQDGKLVRIVEVAGRPTVAWATALGPLADLDACDGDAILARTPPDADHATTVVSLARATGALTGRVDGVRGMWPARGAGAAGSVELASATGVEIWPRTLVGPPRATRLPGLGELLAARGEARLVRATEHTAVVLDARGVRAHVALASQTAALGDRAVVGASYVGSPGETAHRFALPDRLRRAFRLVPGRGAMVPAELRDLPVAGAADPLAAGAVIDGAGGGGASEIAALAVDPAAPAVIYASAFDPPARDDRGALVAAVDLAARQWRWQRADGCGPGQPLGLALAADVVVCAARTVAPRAGSVRATGRDGAARWAWAGDNVDRVQAAGDSVIVHDADQLHVLDAATGALRGRLASDDRAGFRAAIFVAGDATVLASYEHGRVVARLPGAGLVAVWSVAVDGVVRALSASRDGVLVELEDGDAYRLDGRTGGAAALPGLGGVWRATGDLVTGVHPGGPIPGVVAPVAAPAVVAPARRRRGPAASRRGPSARTPADDAERPKQWTPIPPPPSPGDSWQYTLYELAGGLRARNDYPLPAPVAPATARGPAGSPLVVAAGVEQRDILVLDPRSGTPLQRVALPAGIRALVFGTVVDGTPVAGAIVAAPLRAVVF